MEASQHTDMGKFVASQLDMLSPHVNQLDSSCRPVISVLVSETLSVSANHSRVAVEI